MHRTDVGHRVDDVCIVEQVVASILAGDECEDIGGIKGLQGGRDLIAVVVGRVFVSNLLDEVLSTEIPPKALASR